MRDGLEIDDGLSDGLDMLDVLDEEEMWGTKEIAAAWKLNREYVTDIVVKKPDFPQPALNLSRKTKRWMRVDCQAWRERHAGR